MEEVLTLASKEIGKRQRPASAEAPGSDPLSHPAIPSTEPGSISSTMQILIIELVLLECNCTNIIDAGVHFPSVGVASNFGPFVNSPDAHANILV